jgi:ATP-dependent Lon protease
MRESAAAALSYVKAHVADLGDSIAEDWMSKHDIHVHVPAGAIPKDGPSAGVTITTALVSLVTGRPVRSDVAMTGEVTLTGQVLPIGGLKEKALAAQRTGISRVIAPKLNEPDIEDIPAHLREQLEFHFVDNVDEVLALALEGGEEPARAVRRVRAARRRRRGPRERPRGTGRRLEEEPIERG